MEYTFQADLKFEVWKYFGCLWVSHWRSDFLVPSEVLLSHRYLLVSTYVVCERLSVMHKQVSGWTVNFGSKFWECPTLRTVEYPPHLWKLKFRQILELWVLTWQSTPPPNLNLGRSWNFEFWLGRVPPSPQWKLWESPSPRVSEYRELLYVETLSNPDNYSFVTISTQLFITVSYFLDMPVIGDLIKHNSVKINNSCIIIIVLRTWGTVSWFLSERMHRVLLNSDHSSKFSIAPKWIV